MSEEIVSRIIPALDFDGRCLECGAPRDRLAHGPFCSKKECGCIVAGVYVSSSCFYHEMGDIGKMWLKDLHWADDWNGRERWPWRNEHD